jgi:hypothetical protein
VPIAGNMSVPEDVERCMAAVIRTPEAEPPGAQQKPP